MILLQRPGQDPLEIEFIMLNFEGTLATDGRVHPKAKDKINLLSKRARIFIFTTGEKESVSAVLRNVKAEVVYLREGDVSREKRDLLQQLGPRRTVAMGSGMSDIEMIQNSGLRHRRDEQRRNPVRCDRQGGSCVYDGR